MAVLGLLVEGDLHGYELKKRLADLLGPWSSVSFGSLYPALSRLERNGLVASVPESTESPDVAETPMSGSLGAELAAYRRQRTRRRGTGGGRRARKVYAITDAGRAELERQLLEESGDERGFAVRVAFCRLLRPDQRLDVFTRRRDALRARLAERDGERRGDVYRRSLLEFQDDRLRRELDWVEQLIRSVHDDPQAPEPLTSGGSPS